MVIIKRIAALLLFILLIFVGHVMISTGLFRTINPKFEGKVLQKIPIPGAEDMMVSLVDSFVLISSTDRKIYPPKDQEKGGLFLIDLKTKGFKTIPLTESFNKPFSPHGISFFKKDSSYQVMAINHTTEGHSIEVFELRDKVLNHLKTLKDPAMIQPNDLVMVDENNFYFTNDHRYTKGPGKLLEDYAGYAVSNVVYSNQGEYNEVANGIAYANGINIDQKRNLVYVASPRLFLIKVFSKNQDGSLTFIENIPCGTGVDNIELDKDGNLWVGAHPNLLKFKAYSLNFAETTPSEIIKIKYKGKGDFTIEKIYVEKGNEMSGSTVAVPFGNLIFTGNVMDDKFLILERSPIEMSK